MSDKYVSAAKALREAMRGFGTDEEKIIRVLSTVPKDDAADLVKAYSDEIGRDLVKDFKSELRGSFEDACVNCVTPYHTQLAQQAYEAMKGIGTDETLLIETLLPLSDEDLVAVKEEFKRMYSNSLSGRVSGELGGHLRDLFGNIFEAVFENGGRTDGDVADDVVKLHTAAEGFGTDEDAFKCVASKSRAHRDAVVDGYQKLYGRSLYSVIEKEFSGDMKHALLALFKPVDKFFHDVLDKDPNDKCVRVITQERGRALPAIIKQFDKDDKALFVRVEGAFRGDTEKLLVAIVLNNSK